MVVLIIGKVSQRLRVPTRLINELWIFILVQGLLVESFHDWDVNGMNARVCGFAACIYS